MSLTSCIVTVPNSSFKLIIIKIIVLIVLQLKILLSTMIRKLQKSLYEKKKKQYRKIELPTFLNFDGSHIT